MSLTACTAWSWRALLAVALLVLATAACDRPSDPLMLASRGASDRGVTVSGVSAGGYMAGQFHAVHSRWVIGAAIVAGGPYGCAESLFADAMPGPGVAFLNLSKAVNGCMLYGLKMFGIPDAGKLVTRARALAQAGRIDPLTALAGGRVYFYSGKADQVVVPEIVAEAVAFYRAAGMPDASIKSLMDQPAGHAWVTENEGLECGETDEPYLNKCGYDQAGELLKHVYGAMQPPSADQTGALLAFDQREFVKGFTDHGFGKRGYVYVPTACSGNGSRCRIHVTFHGCKQGHEFVGETFVRKAGFQRWADTNKLIVLFPQIESTPVNPNGCWDWWGYTGRDYLTRNGTQITAVRRMIDRLIGRSPDE